MKPQSKPQVVILIGDQVHNGPLSPDLYGSINPGFWMALARVRARQERDMKKQPAPAQAS